MFPILIVDDAREDQILAESALRHSKILNPVRFMTTGEECVRYFQGAWRSKDGDAPEPCVLLLDLGMRPVGGIEVLRQIQGLPMTRESICIMVSGINDIKMVRQGYQLGAQTFLIKPLTREEIMEFVGSMKNRIHIDERADGRALRWVAFEEAFSGADEPSGTRREMKSLS
jgi:CheY-like chemotaxis protein